MNKLNDESFGRQIAELHFALFKRLSFHLKEKDLPITPDQLRVLKCLWHNDGQPQIELAHCIKRNRANVTRVVDILEREGLVERKAHPSDRRSYLVYLTETGRLLENDALACKKMVTDEALADVSIQDIQTCMKVLKIAKQNLRQLAQDCDQPSNE